MDTVTLGSLSLTGGPIRLGDGFDPGDAQALVDVIRSVFLDGSIVTGDAFDNRSVQIPLLITASSRAELAQLTEAVAAEANKTSNELKWSPYGGISMIFDVFRMQMTVAWDKRLASEQFTRQVVLAGQALPFPRSAETLTPSAANAGTQLTSFDRDDMEGFPPGYRGNVRSGCPTSASYMFHHAGTGLLVQSGPISDWGGYMNIDNASYGGWDIVYSVAGSNPWAYSRLWDKNVRKGDRVWGNFSPSGWGKQQGGAATKDIIVRVSLVGVKYQYSNGTNSWNSGGTAQEAWRLTTGWMKVYDYATQAQVTPQYLDAKANRNQLDDNFPWYIAGDVPNDGAESICMFLEFQNPEQWTGLASMLRYDIGFSNPITSSLVNSSPPASNKEGLGEGVLYGTSFLGGNNSAMTFMGQNYPANSTWAECFQDKMALNHYLQTVDISSYTKLKVWAYTSGPANVVFKDDGTRDLYIWLYDPAGRASKFKFPASSGVTGTGAHSTWYRLIADLTAPVATTGGGCDLTQVQAISFEFFWTNFPTDTTTPANNIAIWLDDLRAAPPDDPNTFTTLRGSVYTLNDIKGSAKSPCAITLSGSAMTDIVMYSAPPEENDNSLYPSLLQVTSNAASAPAPVALDGVYSVLAAVSPATALASPQLVIAQSGTSKNMLQGEGTAFHTAASTYWGSVSGVYTFNVSTSGATTVYWKYNNYKSYCINVSTPSGSTDTIIASDQGTGGFARRPKVTPGKDYTASIHTSMSQYQGVTRNVQIGIRWYDKNGNIIQEDWSDTFYYRTQNTPIRPYITRNAPVGAYNASILLKWPYVGDRIGGNPYYVGLAMFEQSSKMSAYVDPASASSSSVTLTGIQQAGNRYIDFGQVTLPLVPPTDENVSVGYTFTLTPASTAWADILLLNSNGNLIWIPDTGAGNTYDYFFADKPDISNGIGRLWGGSSADRSDAKSVMDKAIISGGPLQVKAPKARVLCYSTIAPPGISLSYNPHWLTEPTS